MWSIQILFGTTNKSKSSQINILLWITPKLNLQDSDSRMATLHDICQIFNQSLQLPSKRFPIGGWTNFKSILVISVVEVFNWKINSSLNRPNFLKSDLLPKMIFRYNAWQVSSNIKSIIVLMFYLLSYLKIYKLLWYVCHKKMGKCGNFDKTAKSTQIPLLL